MDCCPNSSELFSTRETIEAHEIHNQSKTTKLEKTPS
jgi:hypothetical protein